MFYFTNYHYVNDDKAMLCVCDDPKDNIRQRKSAVTPTYTLVNKPVTIKNKKTKHALFSELTIQDGARYSQRCLIESHAIAESEVQSKALPKALLGCLKS